ncbi:MAG: hypothetical protein KDJ69_16920 [Nitratireductor sp.]|nr:hypothetical protein [Nitratireductor sp.]
MRLPHRFTDRLYRWSIKLRCRRLPDVQIGGAEHPYLNRWYVIPRNRFFNIYLHEFVRDDDDRALHDHPWWSFSIMLSGLIIEQLKGGDKRLVDPGDIIVRPARFAHRIEVVGKPCVTLFITGPRIREWGFHCPEDSPAGGWRHWKDFTAPGDSSRIGRGCE